MKKNTLYTVLYTFYKGLYFTILLSMWKDLKQSTNRTFVYVSRCIFESMPCLKLEDVKIEFQTKDEITWNKRLSQSRCWRVLPPGS